MTTKILVVDDSLMVRRQVENALSAAGYAVTSATNGVDALQKLAADIRLIVCDVNMPMMNGLEFLAALRNERNLTIPIIMLTTEGQADMIRQAKALGANAWIVKPMKPELLLNAAKKLTSAA